MKKIRKIVILLIVFIALFGCKKDDIVDNSWIYGKWYVTHFSEAENGTYKDASILNNYAQFNEDGTYKSYYLSDYYIGTYTVNENIISAFVGGETVIYEILERKDNKAKAKMHYKSDPSDVIYYKLEKR